MTRKELQEQLLSLVDGNPDIEEKIRNEIMEGVGKFSEEAIIKMIEYVLGYYKTVTKAYKKADRELKVIARQVEKNLEQHARETEKITIKSIEDKLKKAKKRLA